MKEKKQELGLRLTWTNRTWMAFIPLILGSVCEHYDYDLIVAICFIFTTVILLSEARLAIDTWE